MEENKSNNIQRDYDKEPIIIKDYNIIFGFWIQLLVIIIFINILIFKDNVPFHTTISYLAILLPIYLYPRVKKHYKSMGKRYIKLTNDEIIFMQENKSLENIKVNKITNTYKIIHDYYHVSQTIASNFWKIFYYMTTPIYFIILIIFKFFFHIKKDGLKSYKFYDAVIVFSNEKFINILPSTVEEYEKIREYFMYKKNIDIKQQDTYTKILYEVEELNNKGSEND